MGSAPWYVWTLDLPDRPTLTPSAELTTTSMELTFENVAASIKCMTCKAAFNERLAWALTDWGRQKVRLLFSLIVNCS